MVSSDNCAVSEKNEKTLNLTDLKMDFLIMLNHKHLQ